MLPYIIKFHELVISGYFFFMTLGFLAGFSVGLWQSKRLGINQKRFVDLCIVAYISGLVGAKLVHVIVEPSSIYHDDWLQVFYIWKGGFVFYGGFALAFIACYIFVRLAKLPVSDASDAAAPGIWLGLGLGRIGCLSAGCCYGAPTDWWWGISFHEVQGVTPFARPLGVPLHPTQALEALFCFFLAAACVWMNRKRTVPGVTMVFSILAYSLWRFVIEFFRGDVERGIWLSNLSTSQLFSIPTFAIGLVFMVYLLKRPSRSI